MFDIVTVAIIGGATMLMGRKQLLMLSRVLGKGLGMLVGTIQGSRYKLEQHTKHSELGQLRESVKKGLRDMSSITTDILYSGESTPTRAPVLQPYRNADVNMMSQTPTQTPTPITIPNFQTTNHGIDLNPQQSASYIPNLGSNSVELERIARLILADEQLAKKTGNQEKQVKSGASIVQTAISTSILNNFYAQSLSSSSSPPKSHE